MQEYKSRQISHINRSDKVSLELKSHRPKLVTDLCVLSVLERRLKDKSSCMTGRMKKTGYESNVWHRKKTKEQI